MNLSKRDREQLGPDACWEIYVYLAYRQVRFVRDKLCNNREAKKYLTRVMKRLKKTDV